jgi:hypothetical protein
MAIREKPDKQAGHPAVLLVSSPPMRPSLLLLLFSLTSQFPATAEDDWRQAAREFLKEQDFAPIEIKPGTRSEADLARERWTWMQRVLLPPFEKHLAQWPQQAEAARSFVKQALMTQCWHPDVDPARSWKVLAQEAEALVKAKLDEPLVLWLAAWAIWESHEGYTECRDCLTKASRHKLLKNYPSVLAAHIQEQFNECRRTPNPDSIAKTNEERFKHMMKCAADPEVYKPEEDEILFSDVEFVFSTGHVTKHGDELRQFCETPHFTPWLREMLLGSLENRIAWMNRGGGYAGTVKDEGWKKFEEHQTLARPHFIKAWELRPDRPQAAASMIDLVKCGNGGSGETLRLWFDRATAAQIDYYSAYYQMLWALRPRWGGSLDQMKALYCATAALDRHEAGIALALRRTLDYLENDADDIHFVLSQEPLKGVVIGSTRALAESDHLYRRWQREWRLADLGLMAWVAGDYETAYNTFQEVPAPFPRQTRRRLNLKANETDVRGLSAIYAFGLNAEWEAAEDAYSRRELDEALQVFQDLSARFQGEPPALLLQRMAACKFEKAFATGKWVPLRAFPDMADWYHCSGFWKGLSTGTLVNTGHDGPAFVLHNGRVGANFELAGLYEIKNAPASSHGLSIMLGYHRTSGSEDWVGCAHWGTSVTGADSSLLRRIYQTKAPHVTPPVNGRIWRFHILCRDGVLTYRLNHRDILVDYPVTDEDVEGFEMRDDSIIGFCHHIFRQDSETHFRLMGIRRLDPAARPEAANPATVEALRKGFADQCRRSVADLNAVTLVEAGLLAGELNRAKKTAEAGKISAFAALLKQDTAVNAADMPLPAAGERALDTLLRGYYASHEARLAALRTEWKSKALNLRGSPEQTSLDAFIHAELDTRPATGVEEPLAAANFLKWQQQTGEWIKDTSVLTGSGDSTILYDFNRAPPFQIDFEINVLDGRRARLVMGNVKFANEAGKTTFGLYPQVKGAPLFTYEHKKPYQITIKATTDKTELFVDGVKVCDGPKINNAVEVLQFRAGDDYSKGKAEFRKIRLSPLP